MKIANNVVRYPMIFLEAKVLFLLQNSVIRVPKRLLYKPCYSYLHVCDNGIHLYDAEAPIAKSKIILHVYKIMSLSIREG